jgi:NitT/TauT family transport system substrate-binding protein
VRIRPRHAEKRNWGVSPIIPGTSSDKAKRARVSTNNKPILFRKIFFSALVVLLFVGNVSNSPQALAADEVTKVKIAYLPIVQALPLYMAIDKGYFKQAGIDVEAVRFEAPNQIIDALLAGNVDFSAPGAATGITAVSQYRNPGTLKIYELGGSVSPNHLDHVFLVKKDSQLSDIKELKGKKLGTMPGIQWRTISTHVLMRAGLTAGTDVELVQLALPLQLQALSSGQVDALLTLEPIGTIGKAQGVAKDLLIGPVTKYVADPFYGGCGVVPTAFASKNPKTTALLLSVFKRAVQEINHDPKLARQYLKNYTPLNDETITKVPLPIWKMYSDFKPSDIKAAQKFVDIFTEHAVVDGKIDFRSLVYGK